MCTPLNYLGVVFNRRGIDTNACVSKVGNSIERAALSLTSMGFEPHNYPLHTIADHFRSFVRSCGEYSLAVLPLTKKHVEKLEQHQYRAVGTLLRTGACVARLKLLACLDLETVRLRHNILSAKWLDSVKNHKGPNLLVKQALIDFASRSVRKPQSQSASSFHFPSTRNPVFAKYNKHCASSSVHGRQDISTFCSQSKAGYYLRNLDDLKLPVPPQSKYSIARTLHSLGVPRERLRFVILWICGYVPFRDWGCAECGGKITKAHLESCVVRSSLPSGSLGERIDNLLSRAVKELDATSALLAVRVLSNEVTRAFPPY